MRPPLEASKPIWQSLAIYVSTSLRIYILVEVAHSKVIKLGVQVELLGVPVIVKNTEFFALLSDVCGENVMAKGFSVVDRVYLSVVVLLMFRSICHRYVHLISIRYISYVV